MNLKKLQAKFRKIIKESKRKSWQSYISTITTKTPTNTLWKKIRNINGIESNAEIQFLDLGDNKYITNPQDIADTLAKTFQKNSNNRIYDERCPTATTDHINLQNGNSHLDDSAPEDTLNLIITLEELKNTLHAIQNSAPRPDNIPNKLIKELPQIDIDHRLKIFNCIWLQ